MLAAEAMGHALVGQSVDTVFANPGTTELHLVEGFGRVPGLQQVLCLFEGVASGAADGFARMAGRPAAVLLHLGPGLGNAIANLHNARRANTPVIVIVGDHATTHVKWDAPLQSDIEGLARPVSVWVRTCRDAARLADDARAAVAAAIALRGVATLIVPADIAWADVDPIDVAPSVVAASAADPHEIAAAVGALGSGDRTAVLLGGGALSRQALRAARGIARATGADLFTDTFVPRIARGGGDPGPEPLPYFGEMAARRLADYRHLVLVGAKHPASFFAYPGQRSECVAPGTSVHHVSVYGGLDVMLGALAAAMGAPPAADVLHVAPPGLMADGPLAPGAVANVVAALMPADSVVVDESNTTGPFLFAGTASARGHDWLRLTGGAIGIGPPLATGAALGAPGRRVVSLQSDGSALYTMQALWTQARERLPITTVLLNNGSYAILNLEMNRLGLDAGPTAALFSLGDPAIDFVALARGFGVAAVRADTVAEFAQAFAGSLDRAAPTLIDVRLSA